MGITGTNREGDAQVSEIPSGFESGRSGGQDFFPVLLSVKRRLTATAGLDRTTSSNPRRLRKFGPVTLPSRNDALFPVILSETHRKIGASVV
jgi:hypothetical protein